ncbi:hypothetical protein ACLBV5_09845 [Brevundimonas sp. M1A4_2e]
MTTTNTPTPGNLTDAEKAFLTMAKMADIKIVDLSPDWPGPEGQTNGATAYRQFSRSAFTHMDRLRATVGLITNWTPDVFPIVASTFEVLTIERPELREHYDRAKEAWEASQ